MTAVANKLVDPNYAYAFLKSKGYDGDARTTGPTPPKGNGEILSGWYLNSNHLPARVGKRIQKLPT